jgi:hypothetical protein
MTKTERPISTQVINVAAFIIAATDQDCTISFYGNLATFTFPSNLLTRDALIGYETDMEVSGRRLLTVRDQLFRRIRGGGR